MSPDILPVGTAKQWSYRERDCKIQKNDLGHWCGYTRTTLDGFTDDDLYDVASGNRLITVHGGITYGPDADGLIADGEHRWRAALELGLSEVPVKQYDLADEERRLLRQELNKIEGEHNSLRDAQEYDTLLSGGMTEPVEELTAARDEDLEELLNEMQEKQVDPDEVDEMTGSGPAGTGDAGGDGEQHPSVAGPTREAPDDPKAPPVQQEGTNDAREEWDKAGTAEDTNEDLTSEFKAHVHFRNEDDLQAFEELVGQTIPRNTWAIWYPEAERLDASDTYAVAQAADGEAETDGDSETPADESDGEGGGSGN